MKQINIAIANYDVNVLNSMEQLIGMDKELKLIGKATDGEQLLNIVKDKTPDVVLSDLIMPRIDGLGVLELIRESENMAQPMFIILSSINKDTLIESTFNYGNSYYILKPFNNDFLVKKIKDIVNPNITKTTLRQYRQNEKSDSALTDSDYMYLITKTLRDIGMPINLKGYTYARDAILLALKDKDLLKGVTKIIYPEISKKYQTTPGSVERAIRHSIELLFAKGNLDSIQKIFSYTVNNNSGKVTNSEFIAMVADTIRIKNHL